MITEKKMIFKVMDQIFLVFTLALAVFAIYTISSQRSATISMTAVFLMTAFAVSAIAALALIFGGLDVLSRNVIAVAATLLPISLALAMVNRYVPLWLPVAAGVLGAGFLAVAFARFRNAEKVNRIVYPLLHGLSALIAIALPVFGCMQSGCASSILFLAGGVLLISVGGIALLFLKNGKTFLFFSEALVSHVFTLLFLLTVLLLSLAVLL